MLPLKQSRQQIDRADGEGDLSWFRGAALERLGTEWPPVAHL